MAYSSILKTGTVTVAAGSAVVTGTGTTWLDDGVLPGARISIVGEPLPFGIAKVTSNTSLTLDDAAINGTTGARYAIDRLVYENTLVKSIATREAQWSGAIDLTDVSQTMTLAAGSTGEAWHYLGSQGDAPESRFRIGLASTALDTLAIQRWTGSAWSTMLSFNRSTGSVVGAGGNGAALVYTAKATMDADLAHAASSMAWVVGDADPSLDGIYQKVGASGAGSWVRAGDLPYSFASATAAGTANAITATTDVAASESTLIALTITAPNTASPVTVAFNGGTTLTVLTASGADIPIGGFSAGTVVLGKQNIGDNTFRLVSDYASAAIITAAEAAAAAAAASASAAAASAAVIDPATYVGVASVLGGFFKADPASVCLSRSGLSTVVVSQALRVAVAGILVNVPSGTNVVMPALTAGTDYAIHVCSDGSVRADASFSAPAGYTVANSRRIGGFHYAPGSNAAAQAGGDTTPQINPYSLWDLKWRPTCPDPRGMALVAGRFWADIYLTGTDVDANGSSRYGVTIADGSSPPKIPALFGGNGSTAYSTFTWWQAGEVLSSVGKELLSYGDFATAAYGLAEGVSRGNDPVTTGFATTNAGSSSADEKFTSKWGIVQASGCSWFWGRDISGSAGSTSWQDVTGGRGHLFGTSIAPLFGSNWSDGVNSGSRTSIWYYSPWVTGESFAARGRCDHLWII